MASRTRNIEWDYDSPRSRGRHPGKARHLLDARF
jgi:hypothetical protein